MDSVLVLGKADLQLAKLLDKLGYQAHITGDSSDLVDILPKAQPDLVLVDGCFEFDAVELLNFLRAQESTRQVPIILLAKDRLMQLQATQLGFDKLEIIPQPYRLGTLVSKIATQLRLRKLNGVDPEKASLGEVNARLRELNERFTKQLQEAREIQNSLVSVKLPKDERYSIAVAYQPLEEVGGDWYYVQQEEQGALRVHIADVTGHGLSAAFIGCMTKLAMHAAGATDPQQQLAEMNRFMSVCIPSGKFVTMLSYVYDPATGLLKIVCAGHPPALVLQQEQNVVRQIKSSGFAIGFFEDAEYQQEEITLQVGDSIVILTDALPESQNMSSEVYGYGHIERLLLTNPDQNATGLLKLILSDFDKFRDGRLLKDDVTVIVLKREK